MGEEEDTAGQRNSLGEVREDWEIHHFFSALGGTWQIAARGLKWQMIPGELNSLQKA